MFNPAYLNRKFYIGNFERSRNPIKEYFVFSHREKRIAMEKVAERILQECEACMFAKITYACKTPVEIYDQSSFSDIFHIAYFIHSKVDKDGNYWNNALLIDQKLWILSKHNFVMKAIDNSSYKTFFTYFCRYIELCLQDEKVRNIDIEKLKEKFFKIRCKIQFESQGGLGIEFEYIDKILLNILDCYPFEKGHHEYLKFLSEAERIIGWPDINSSSFHFSVSDIKQKYSYEYLINELIGISKNENTSIFAE